ncbi:hypothetical protein AB8880_08645 [Alphaproteobacteria bacterium LSUCC0684]
MNNTKQRETLTTLLNDKNSERYINEEEIEIYETGGFFEDDEDWHCFIRERKAQSLDYSRPLNLNIMASSTKCTSGINELSQRILSHTNRRLYQPSRIQLNCLLANLFFNYAQSSNLWTIVSRAHEGAIIKKYNPMGLNNETMARLCDAMADLQFLDKEIGYRETSKGKKDGHLTRIRATEDLIKLLKNHGWEHSILHYHPDTIPVVMKETPEGRKTSKPVDYVDTETTKTTSELLWDYHHFLRRREILLPTLLGDKVPDLIFMRQIFSNNSWQEGGRLFGGAYQQLSEDERETITIDGDPVVEIDIASCHATMAFAEAGRDWFKTSNQDIYQRDNLSRWPRNVIKRAFNIAINTENKKKAISALTNADNKEGWFHNHKHLKTPGWQKVLLDEMQDAYPEITHLFFKRRGMVYMRQEGEIGLRIIADGMNRGIPVLTLHDSFIAPKQHEATLCAIISDAFETVVGISCHLK